VAEGGVDLGELEGDQGGVEGDPPLPEVGAHPLQDGEGLLGPPQAGGDEAFHPVAGERRISRRRPHWGLRV
jgi:hypothetical protein